MPPARSDNDPNSFSMAPPNTWPPAPNALPPTPLGPTKQRGPPLGGPRAITPRRSCAGCGSAQRRPPRPPPPPPPPRPPPPLPPPRPRRCSCSSSCCRTRCPRPPDGSPPGPPSPLPRDARPGSPRPGWGPSCARIRTRSRSRSRSRSLSRSLSRSGTTITIPRGATFRLSPGGRYGSPCLIHPSFRPRSHPGGRRVGMNMSSPTKSAGAGSGASGAERERLRT